VLARKCRDKGRVLQGCGGCRGVQPGRVQTIVAMAVANVLAFVLWWVLPAMGVQTDWWAWYIGLACFLVAGYLSPVWWLALPLAGMAGFSMAVLDFVTTIRLRGGGVGAGVAEVWSDVVLVLFGVAAVAAAAFGAGMRLSFGWWRARTAPQT